MYRGFLFTLAIIGMLGSRGSAQTLPPDFPKGVKRTWYSFGGRQQELVIVDIVRNQSVTVASDLSGAKTGTSQWSSLHPFDRCWLENAFLWQDQQKSVPGISVANIVPLPANPNRGLIGGPAILEFYGRTAASPKYLVALYLWWWHELGFLTIDQRKGPDDQLEFLMETVDDAFKREGSLDFNQSAGFEKAFGELFKEMYPDNGGFSFFRCVNLSPESLHHHTRSASLTLMGVGHYVRGQKYADLIAVIDVSDTGRIEFIHRGNRIIGQMNPVTSAHRYYRDFHYSGYGWSSDIPAWEIKILNEQALPLDYQKGDTQFFVDASNRLSLWVAQPCKFTAKQFVGTPAPPVPAMPVKLPDPNETPQPDTKKPVVRDPQFFSTRRTGASSSIAPPAFNPTIRTWSDLSGRTIDAKFVACERLVDGSLVAKVATAGGPASLVVSQLSPADAAYLTFLTFDRHNYGPQPPRSGSLTYLLQSAKAGSFEIKISYGNLRCLVEVRPAENRSESSESLLAKARELFVGKDEYRLQVDYPLFSYRMTGAPGSSAIRPEDLVVKRAMAPGGQSRPETLADWFNRSNSTEHLGLPCRVMLDLEKRGLAGPGFTGAGKVAAFSTEESIYVWKILCNDPNVPGSSLLQSFKPFAEKWYEGGVIPMDVRMTHQLDPQASVQLKLIEYDFSVGAPDFSLE